MNQLVLLFAAVLLFVVPTIGRTQIPARPDSPEASPEPTTAKVEATPSEGAAPNDTQIFDMKETTFTAKDRTAVFKGDVRVIDPRFTIGCETLTVFLNKNAVAAAAPAPEAAPPPVKPAANEGDEKPRGSDRGSGIDHAVAEGGVTIIQKRAPTKAGEEEKVTVAHADRAEYDGKTGDMTLRGMPKVEQNGDFHEALSRSTYMVLHSDNSLETHGPSSTHIAPRGDGASPGGKPGGSPPAGSPGKRTPQSGKQS